MMYTLLYLIKYNKYYVIPFLRHTPHLKFNYKLYDLPPNRVNDAQITLDYKLVFADHSNKIRRHYECLDLSFAKYIVLQFLNY